MAAGQPGHDCSAPRRATGHGPSRGVCRWAAAPRSRHATLQAMHSLSRHVPQAAAPAPAAQMPTLSVIIQARGAPHLLQASVAALLAGAGAELEIIVAAAAGTAAGAMPAGSGALGADGRVRFITAAAGEIPCNAGLREAGGDYVGFMDEGDAAEPGWAGILLRAAAASGRGALIKGEALVIMQGRELPLPRSCALIARHTPLHWFTLPQTAIYRRSLMVSHGLHLAAAGLVGEEDFLVRAVVAALLEEGAITLCPQAACRLQHRSVSRGRYSVQRAQAEGELAICAGVHELLLRHHAALPEAGVGAQYCAWIGRVLDLTRSAAHPACGAAANALAQRLRLECPCPEAYEAESARLGRQFADLSVQAER